MSPISLVSSCWVGNVFYEFDFILTLFTSPCACKHLRRALEYDVIIQRCSIIDLRYMCVLYIRFIKRSSDPIVFKASVTSPWSPTFTKCRYLIPTFLYIYWQKTLFRFSVNITGWCGGKIANQQFPPSKKQDIYRQNQMSCSGNS